MTTKETNFYSRMLAAKEKQKVDQEQAHVDADNILCDALIKADMPELVEIYRSIQKWYA